MFKNQLYIHHIDPDNADKDDTCNISDVYRTLRALTARPFILPSAK